MEATADYSPTSAKPSNSMNGAKQPADASEETSATILTKAYLREDGDNAYLRVECVAGPSSVGIEVTIDSQYRETPFLQPGLSEQVEDLVECSQLLLRTLRAGSEDVPAAEDRRE